LGIKNSKKIGGLGIKNSKKIGGLGIYFEKMLIFAALNHLFHLII